MRFAALAFVVLAACGSKTPPSHATDKPVTDTSNVGSGSGSAEPATPEKIGVALQVEPADANVEIDDLVVGKASQLDPVFALAPGLHTLVIKLAGYKTYRMEFSVTDKTESFTIHLDPK